MMQSVTLSNGNTYNTISWLSAIVICFQYVCAVLAIPRISIFIAMGLIAYSLYLIGTHRIKIYRTFIGVTFYIIVVFLISLLFSSHTAETINYMERFLLYDLIAFLIGFQISETKRIVKNTIIIGLIGLPLLLTKNLLLMNTSNRMGFSYACLPILISSLIGLRYERKYKLISAICIIAIVIKVYAYAPRGILVVFATGLVLLLYYKLGNGKIKGIKLFGSIFALAIVFAGVLYVFQNLEGIITLANQFLSKNFNIHIYAFDKYIRYLAQDKMLNGRDDIWRVAVELIKSNPIFGHGIGYFEYFSGKPYCHNVFLQSFCEAGVFFGIPVAIYVVVNALLLLRGAFINDENSYTWVVFAFTVGVEMLFFSSVYWMYSPFWFFFAAYIRNRNFHKSWGNEE